MIGTPMVLALGATTVVLLLAVATRPRSVESTAGKVVAFGAFLALPVLATSLGTHLHLEHSKRTEFCLSCHEMEPYGASLYVDDADYVPASHFQNLRVDRERACYACHTTYTMYGDLSAKLKGLRHVWVHYVGEIPETIELYEPYDNRECLHCHAGARSFEESELHVDFQQEFASGETSCLECHDLVHAVEDLPELPRWSPAGGDGDA